MQIRDWMVESATRHAADYIVTFVGGMCQKMDREEGSVMKGSNAGISRNAWTLREHRRA